MIASVLAILIIVTEGVEYTVPLPIEQVAREASEISSRIEHRVNEASRELANLKARLREAYIEYSSAVEPGRRDSLWYKVMAIKSEITTLGYNLISDVSTALKDLRGKIATLNSLLAQASDEALASAEEVQKIRYEVSESLEKTKRALGHIYELWQAVKPDRELSDELKYIASLKKMQVEEEESILRSIQEIAHTCSTYAKQCSDIGLQIRDYENQITELIDILENKAKLLKAEAHLGYTMVRIRRHIDAVNYSFKGLDLPNLSNIQDIINDAIELSLPVVGTKERRSSTTQLNFHLFRTTPLSDEEMEQLKKYKEGGKQ
ncbi:MAG: hypothetical protein DRG83_03810 [Deltaproteobacteria bacterium]|nr:MAG: hypothetical protein DRG83_03810 [Deltaproteobacteria bacterium]